MANIKTITYVSLALAGLILAIVCGTIRFAYLDKIIHSQVADKMYIGNGTESWDAFVKFPIPLRFSFYFFHVTNPEDFKGKNIKSLNIEFVGPYVYEENRTKDEIVFLEDNKVEYVEHKTYTFNQEESGNRTEDDVLNFFSIGLAMDFPGNIVEQQAVKGIVNIILNGANPLPDVKMVVDTGKGNIDNIGQLYKYDNKTKLDNVWLPFGPCNDLVGTDAVNFKPGLTEDDTIWAFEPMLCRSLFFKSKRMPNIEVRGIPTLRFLIDEDNFERDILENTCYCLDDFRDLSTFFCQTGLLTLKTCGVSKGYNFAATPPFYYSNKEMQKVTNLTAPLPVNFENWGTILDIEPITGITLKASKKIQINMVANRNSLPDLDNHHMIVPLAMVEESATVDEENANKLEELVFKPKRLASGLLIAGFVIGIVLFIVGGGLLFYFK